MPSGLDFSTASRIFSAISGTAGVRMLGNRMTNSSPPYRHSTSDVRTLSFKDFATLLSTVSPLGWPYLSLIFLKWSISIMKTAIFSLLRSARENNSFATSKNPRRLNRPVKASVMAMSTKALFLLQRLCSVSPNSSNSGVIWLYWMNISINFLIWRSCVSEGSISPPRGFKALKSTSKVGCSM